MEVGGRVRWWVMWSLLVLLLADRTHRVNAWPLLIEFLQRDRHPPNTGHSLGWVHHKHVLELSVVLHAIA